MEIHHRAPEEGKVTRQLPAMLPPPAITLLKGYEQPLITDPETEWSAERTTDYWVSLKLCMDSFLCVQEL